MPSPGFDFIAPLLWRDDHDGLLERAVSFDGHQRVRQELVPRVGGRLSVVSAGSAGNQRQTRGPGPTPAEVAAKCRTAFEFRTPIFRLSKVTALTAGERAVRDRARPLHRPEHESANMGRRVVHRLRDCVREVRASALDRACGDRTRSGGERPTRHARVSRSCDRSVHRCSGYDRANASSERSECACACAGGGVEPGGWDDGQASR